MKRVFEFLETPVENTGRQLANNFHIHRKIVFDSVSYSFDGQNKVLDNLSLGFESGKRYALVGASGCGKSTLINLLCRFYETKEGIIRVDGQNIQQINLDTLRSRIGLISQESMLFHDSIRENISYGSMNPSDIKIEEAAKISGIYEHVVSLHNGFQSMVGDKGTKLSGGQKQRIAIARAILKDTDRLFSMKQPRDLIRKVKNRFLMSL